VACLVLWSSAKQHVVIAGLPFVRRGEKTLLTLPWIIIVLLCNGIGLFDAAPVVFSTLLPVKQTN